MSGTASNWWQIAPFPNSASTVTATSTTSSAAVALGSGGGRYMFTAYTANAFIRFGDSAVTAATAATGGFGMDIPAGSKGVIYLPDSVTHYRVITDTGAGNLSVGKVGN